ncbi:hypothetical protein PSSHI_33190 [Photobacterium sp. R1]
MRHSPLNAATWTPPVVNNSVRFYKVWDCRSTFGLLIGIDAMTLMTLRGCGSSFVRRHQRCPPHYQVFPQKV